MKTKNKKKQWEEPKIIKIAIKRCQRSDVASLQN